MHARAELERLDAERGQLAEEAAELHRAPAPARLAERPGLPDAAGRAPGESLDELADWATEARAALLVARSNLAAQRDAVIRQANELGALVLGEPHRRPEPVRGASAGRIAERRRVAAAPSNEGCHAVRERRDTVYRQMEPAPNTPGGLSAVAAAFEFAVVWATVSRWPRSACPRT